MQTMVNMCMPVTHPMHPMQLFPTSPLATDYCFRSSDLDPVPVLASIAPGEDIPHGLNRAMMDIEINGKGNSILKKWMNVVIRHYGSDTGSAYCKRQCLYLQEANKYWKITQ